jgi:hypothetical protein
MAISAVNVVYTNESLPMKWLIRVLAYLRSQALSKQFKEVQRNLAGLDRGQRAELLGLMLKELAAAAKNPIPMLHGSQDLERYRPWGNGCEIAMDRIRTGNLALKLRGLSLWLAVAYHETREARFPELEQLHKAIMREMRLIKEAVSANEVDALKRAGLEITA